MRKKYLSTKEHIANIRKIIENSIDSDNAREQFEGYVIKYNHSNSARMRFLLKAMFRDLVYSTKPDMFENELFVEYIYGKGNTKNYPLESYLRLLNNNAVLRETVLGNSLGCLLTRIIDINKDTIEWDEDESLEEVVEREPKLRIISGALHSKLEVAEFLLRSIEKYRDDYIYELIGDKIVPLSTIRKLVDINKNSKENIDFFYSKLNGKHTRQAIQQEVGKAFKKRV